MAKEERKEREGIWLSIGSDRDDDRSRKYTSKKMKSKFEFYYDDSSSSHYFSVIAEAMSYYYCY